jgi:hypothetical protein
MTYQEPGAAKQIYPHPRQSLKFYEWLKSSLAGGIRPGLLNASGEALFSAVFNRLKIHHLLKISFRAGVASPLP